MTRTICIYHGNCADGFTAAWAVWRALGDAVEFIPGNYGAARPKSALPGSKASGWKRKISGETVRRDK